MSAPDDLPSFADLALRRALVRASARKSSRPVQPRFAPSLFDALPAEPPSSPAAEHAPVQPAENAPSPSVPARPVQASAAPPIAEPPRVWTVASLVRRVRGMVEQSFAGPLTVEGEISNWRPAASGHCYFTLKGGDAQLSTVLFRSQALRLSFRPKDGDAVRLQGQLSVYENRGQMQLIAASMELAGMGAQLAAVQELKARLRAEGLFERKRPLPAFPKCIGVITSPHGAALRDIVKVCRRRHAAVNLLIYPAAVQGPRCPAEVIAGLRWFNAHSERVDVVLVARGGGSWEDLHGFDDEGVVRAIAACAVPVVSGVGHATDSTLADAAADLCVPTPSAAAELVTAAQHRIDEHVQRLQARVLRAGSYEVLRSRQRLSRLGSDATLRHVRESITQRVQRIDELGFRLDAAAARTRQLRQNTLRLLDARLQARHVSRQLPALLQQHERLRTRLEGAAGSLLLRQRTRIHTTFSQLGALSPLRVLERGYALVYSDDGILLRDAGKTEKGRMLTARLARGVIEARVEETDAGADR